VDESIIAGTDFQAMVRSCVSIQWELREENLAELENEPMELHVERLKAELCNQKERNEWMVRHIEKLKGELHDEKEHNELMDRHFKVLEVELQVERDQNTWMHYCAEMLKGQLEERITSLEAELDKAKQTLGK
jgi:hypothetical protein